jgi:DNA-directed RNA polymerase subunit omega
MLPSPDILNEYEHGKFILSNLAAKRARQLREGAVPLVQVDSNHPLTVALAEIAAGRIKAILPDPSVGIEDADAPTLQDDLVAAELGLLLPALDETEVALVGTVLDEDHDHDHDHDHEVAEVAAAGGGLADLLEPEEVVAPEPEEDTLSLSDIAEQETHLEEEEPEE